MNNKMNFDPMTGQPIQHSDIQPNIQKDIENVQEPTISTNEIVQNNIPEQYVNTNERNSEQINLIQNQLQAIPTVEQNHQEFINNVQSENAKKEEKKEVSNYAFIIILFIVILVAIFFLFPLLAKYI